ncbi:HAD family hydrolase [Streptomyces sp. NPDC059491]|uniref:HAD family hydrolase n=1 Tax=Streptomyces sp. NPDC059491 TaxID=3346850 RepID=UPI0036C131B2
MTGRPPSRAPGAVLFDTDGVLLDSARVHAAAWKGAFDAFLAARTGDGAAQPPFDPDADYRRYVDGKSRHDGAAAFLAARGIALPTGTPRDPPGSGTIRSVAAHKEQLFRSLIGAQGVPVFTDTAPALEALRADHLPCAAVSASRHARTLLRASGLAGLLTAIVDGEDAARLGLAGKPDPALFLHAAARLGHEPADTAVVEDALAGVRAARRGGFGLVVGLDRTPDRSMTGPLRDQGADLTVTALTALVRHLRGDAA